MKPLYVIICETNIYGVWATPEDAVRSYFSFGIKFVIKNFL